MEYLCRMRAVGYTSTKLLSVHVRDAFRISTWSLFSGLCFQARNSRHPLFFCWRWRLSNSVALLRAPPSGLGRNSCFRCKASCTEPRGLVRCASSHAAKPGCFSAIYIYIYIALGKKSKIADKMFIINIIQTILPRICVNMELLPM